MEEMEEKIVTKTLPKSGEELILSLQKQMKLKNRIKSGKSLDEIKKEDQRLKGKETRLMER